MNYEFILPAVVRDDVKYTGAIELRLQERATKQRTIDLEQCPEKVWTFAASGWTKENGRDASGGQCLDEIERIWGDLLPARVRRVIELWERWHLNDLKAGTREQAAAIAHSFDDENRYTFDLACEYLRNAELYKDRGYHYGCEWLVELLPQEVVDEIHTIIEGEGK